MNLGRKKSAAFLLLGIFGFCLSLIPQSVQAISNFGPDQNDFSPNEKVRLVVAKPFTGYNLDAPTSIVKVYSLTANPVVTIYHPNHCVRNPVPAPDLNIDTSGSPGVGSDTAFIFTANSGSQYPTGSNGGGNAVLNSASSTCEDDVWTTQLAHTDAVNIGGTTYYVASLTATINVGGINAFWVSTNSGFISLSDTSGTTFALQSRGNPAASTTFNLKFGLPCGLPSTSTRFAWFDDDQGNATAQPTSISYDLERRPKGSSGVWSNVVHYVPDSGGNGASREQFYTIDPDYEYNWRWNDVGFNNGIQFQIPYDSIYALATCTPPIQAMQIGADLNCTGIWGAIFNPNYTNGNRNTGRIDMYVNGPAGSGTRYAFGGPATTSPNIPSTVARPNFGFDIADWPPGFKGQINDGNRHDIYVYALSTTTEDPTASTAMVHLVRTAGSCFDYELTPQVNVSPDVVEEGDTAIFSFSITRIGGPNSPSVVWCTYLENIPVATPAGPPVSNAPNEPTDRGASQGCTPQSFTNGTTTLGTRPVPTSAFPPGQKVCMTLTVSPAYGYIANSHRYSEQRCAVIAKRPYVHVMGGDIRAGGSYANGAGVCTLVSGSITTASYNWDRGSGSEYAAFASGAISRFGTKAVSGRGGINTTSFESSDTWQLTFANRVNRGLFDAGKIRCLTDYLKPYQDKNLPTTSTGGLVVDPVALASASGTIVEKRYTITSGGVLTIRPAVNAKMPLNAKVVILVDGDGSVTIDRNIEYVDNYTSRQAIPSFALVTTRNINITQDVTRLDGFYATKSTLNTCSTFALGDLNSNRCNQQLVFNGAVVADRLTLLRTFGGRGVEARLPGELFNYSPELLLNNVLNGPDSNVIRSLDEKDLPARY